MRSRVSWSGFNNYTFTRPVTKQLGTGDVSHRLISTRLIINQIEMNKFRKAIVLLLSVLVCLGSSVRYYDYAVPIPLPKKGASAGVNSALVSSPLTSRGSRAVQFLVNDKRSKGKYHFGYDTGGGDMGSYREEVREPNGTIKGFYGYVDPEGTLRITEYVADSAGFRSSEKKFELRNNISPDLEDLEVMERLQLIGPIPKPLADLFKKSSRT